MRRAAYRALIALVPPPRLRLKGTGLSALQVDRLTALLRHFRSLPAEFVLFDRQGVRACYLYGADEPRAFRVASISKMITSVCVAKLSEQGLIDLDGDVNAWLPYPLRHPKAPDMPITLAMMLAHRAAIRDGGAYRAALVSLQPAQEVLAGDSFCAHLPGEQWQYSNFGAGLVACVLEGALNQSFETLMQQTLFAPLGIHASFYPQRISQPLADARRVLPPFARPGFSALQRKNRPLHDADDPNPQYHYTLAQGNCCMSAKGLQTILRTLMVPGFLSRDTLDLMRRPHGSFGPRAKDMAQGLGLFVLNNPRICANTLYGHQGNAYGAVHAAFFEPKSGRGLLYLSEGVSLSKREFLADVVEELLCFGFREDIWTGIS